MKIFNQPTFGVCKCKRCGTVFQPEPCDTLEYRFSELAEILGVFVRCPTCETICEVTREGATDTNVGNKPISCGHEKGGEWISVDERLPKPNKLVLCMWEREDDGWNYGFARYQREDVWYVSNEGMPKVTHWMPLPDPPMMKGGAE